MKKSINMLVGLITVVISILSAYLVIKMLSSQYIPSMETIIIIFVVCHFSALYYGLSFIQKAMRN